MGFATFEIKVYEFLNSKYFFSMDIVFVSRILIYNLTYYGLIYQCYNTKFELLDSSIHYKLLEIELLNQLRLTNNEIEIKMQSEIHNYPR